MIHPTFTALTQRHRLTMCESLLLITIAEVCPAGGWCNRKDIITACPAVTNTHLFSQNLLAKKLISRRITPLIGGWRKPIGRPRIQYQLTDKGRAVISKCLA